MAKNRKRFLWFACFALLLLGASTAAVVYFKKSEYETIEVRRGSIVEAVYGLGIVKTPRRYELKVGVTSLVTRIFVKEGNVVQVGQPLVMFDSSQTIKSPISGVVTLVDAYESELVSPQKTIARVEDLKDRYIEVALEQQGILRVEEGQAASVLFESLRGEKFLGKVSAVYSRNREFLAHIQVNGMRDNVLPGMTADVAIEVTRHQNALLIPLSSFHSGQVVVSKKGRREKLPVKIGAIDGAWGEVIQGDLHEGDFVVVRRKEKK